MIEATDWDSYYKATPSYTSVTRNISRRKIVGLIREHCGSAALNICEIGGANSCFVERICSDVSVSSYHVVDFNEYGLSLLAKKSVPARLTFEKGDVLEPYNSDKLYDLVYSVGLIEHFDQPDTEKAVAGHFARCKPGGVVLMTFPTPTVPYRTIRSVAEAFRKWSFPDERPLQFGEVEAACSKHGQIVHRSINWLIGLTQGYVVVRKNS